MAYHKCACQCGESLYIPEEFGVGLLNLQKKYEDNFITIYAVFKIGHLNNVKIKEIENQDAN